MPARRAVSGPRRLAVAALVVVGLAAAGAVSSAASARPSGAGVLPDGLVAWPPAASSFFCAALEHIPGVVDSTVAIANLTSQTRVAEVTVSDQNDRVTSRVINVAPGHVVRLHPGTVLRGAVEAVSVLADGGGLAVTEGLTGEAGTAVAPCPSRTSSSWWLTGGSTEQGQTFLVELYNPTHARVVASVRLTDPSGALPPAAYSGLVLNPYQLRPLVVHVVDPNQAPITVHVLASDGEVVAEGIQRGLGGATSLAVLPGTSAAQRELVVPIASSRWPLRTRLELFDTSQSRGASATVQVLPVPTHCAPNCPVPSPVAVPPNGAIAEYEVPTTSVPIGEPFSLVVRAGAPGVLATEVVAASGSNGQGVPADDAGFVGGTRLVLLDPLRGGFSQVGIVNPDTTAVTVTLETGSSRGLRSIGEPHVVSAGQRLVLSGSELAGLDDNALLVLRSTGPVAAAGLAQDATPGAATLPAEPTGS